MNDDPRTYETRRDGPESERDAELVDDRRTRNDVLDDRRGPDDVVDDRRARDVEVDDDRGRYARMPLWSPAQIIGLIAGIGFIVLGVVSVIRTGFDTGDIYRPHEVVWNFPHSPLLGVIEIGFGALLVIASVVPGGARGLLAFLGAVSLAFGIVVLVEQTPNRLNDWLAVTHRSGLLYAVVGAVVLISALLAPVFGGDHGRPVVRQRELVS